jgi:type IV secretion system protein VirB10
MRLTSKEISMKMSSFTAALAALLVIGAPILAADDTITLPKGSELVVQLITTLSSKTNDTGDLWTGKVIQPIFGNGGEIVPEGSTVDGHIAYLKGPGRVKGKGEMRLIADSISTPDTSKYTIVANLLDAKDAPGDKVKGEEGTVQGPGKDTKGTAVETGVGAAAGAGVGAIAHGGTGALYGMGIGAAAALAHGLLKKGKDIVLPQGAELTFVLSRDTTAKKVPVQPGFSPN